MKLYLHRLCSLASGAAEKYHKKMKTRRSKWLLLVRCDKGGLASGAALSRWNKNEKEALEVATITDTHCWQDGLSNKKKGEGTPPACLCLIAFRSI